MSPFIFHSRITSWLSLTLALLASSLFAQPVVVDYGVTNTFTVSAAATNFAWTLDGVAVGGNSNAFAYTPQPDDVGTHYLLVNQTLPGAVKSNSCWAVRVRLTTPVAAQNFYVATNGADTNAGTLGAPFKTLEKAAAAVRALTRPLPAGGVTVWLRGGTFYRTNTLMLANATDSGSATAPVVWRGYPGETAVISAGKAMPAASWVPLNSSQTNRVYPGLNPTNIWEMDLTAAGLTHTNTFPADFGSWTIFNIYGQTSDGGLCELFYNGQRQFLSRWPHHSLINDDLLTTNTTMNGVAKGLLNSPSEMAYPTGGDNTNSLNYPGTYTNSAGQAVAVGGAFYCKTNDLARFTRWQSAITNGGLWLQGYWRVSWQIDTIKIIGFDATNRAVLLDTNAHPANGIGSKYNRPAGNSNEMYCAVNLLEEMNQPGEWCMDFNRNKIYFYAPGPLTDGSVVISDFGSPLVQLTGASNVVFQSLVFDAGLAQGIVITNGLQNLVLGCAFRNLGNYPVDICGGGSNGVVSCDMTNLAAGAVLLRGGTESTNAALRVPAGNFVVNNLITNFARVARVYAAAVDTGFFGVVNGGGGGHYAAVGNRVAHNFISTSPHCAILHSSWDNVFEYNEIAHFQQVSDDLGAFYSYDYSYRHGNQTFRYNFIHDTPLGNGIDFDQDSLAMHIYGNVMNLNTIPAESQGYGVVYHDYNRHALGNEQPVDCYNNLFANTHFGARFVSSVPPINLEQNAAISCTTAYTWELITNYPGDPTNRFLTSSQTVMQSGTNTNYSSDPGFLNLTNNDLRLNPSSRVYTDLPNYQQIPFEMIGLYNDGFRTNASGYAPLITTSNILAFTATNALCGGRLFFPQFESNTTVMIYYGHTDGGTNPTAWQAVTNFGVFAAGSLSSLVGGLDPYTTYYFRYFATNAFGSSWSTASIGINLPPPPAGAVFINLTANQTVLSNSLVTFTGEVVGAGPSFPTNGEIITVTINGSTQSGTVTNNSGNFAVVFNTTNIPASVTPYPVTYAYAGTTNIGGATNASTILNIMPGSITWSGTSDTDFENGGTGGNWNNYPAPLNDLVSDVAIFGGTPTTNHPALTMSRSVKGLTFSSTNGGWTLGSGSTNFLLGIGAGGIVSSLQTNGLNAINANLDIGMNQTWQVGNGGSLLFTGAITNPATGTNYSLVINAGANGGNVILSPAAGNNIVLTGSNNTASIFQVKSGGVLQLGGDGVTAPSTASTNQIINTSTNAFGAFAINTPGKAQVNSGYWIFSDLGKNGSDKLTGTLEVDGGTVSFGGARYLGEGTIQVNGGTLKFGVDATTHYINGGRFSLGNFYSVATATATMNITGGFVDLAQANGGVGGGNGIGYGVSTLLNVSGGVLQNGVTPGTGGTATSFSIGGLNGSGNGTTNNLSAFTLTGGTFISAGVVAASTIAGPGSVNNFNFMGGVLAVQSFNATNLGSSPTATAVANQTNISLALGTLANYGGVLAPGNLGTPGKTLVFGNYAVSNNAAVLAVDLGGTNPANAFQNGSTNYDVVSVSGNTALGGSLSVSLLNNFVPAATNSFMILTNGGTLSGNFTNVIGGRVAVTNLAGGSFAVVTNTRSVMLTNFALLAANFSASTNAGAAPLTVTFTDISTGLITNRFWDFGDGVTTNTISTSVVHTFTVAATNLVSLVVSDALASSTNALVVVVSAPSIPPVFGSVTLSGTNLIFTGTNGAAGGNYYVLAATNLLLPATNWSVIATNQFGPGGSVNFTSPAVSGADQIYYRLRLP